MMRLIKWLWEKGAVHIFTGSFFNKFVTFFGSILVVRILSKTEYGLLGYTENLYSFAYVLAGAGVTNAILRYVVLANTIERKKAIFNFASRFALKVNLVLVAALAIVNSFYTHTKGFEICQIYIYIIVLSLPFQYYVENELSLERAMFNNKKYAVFSLIFASSTVVGRLLGALLNGVLGVVIMGVAVNILLAVIFRASSEKKYFSDIKNTYLDATEKKKIITYSIQYMITNGLWTLFMLIDVFMLGKMSDDPTIIANYRVAYAWPANISIICTAISVFIAPYFIKNENDAKWIRKKYKDTFLISFGVVLLVGVVMILMARPLIFIYGGQAYYDVIPVMRILTIGSIINNGLRYTTANIFAAMGQIKYNMVISAIGIVIQIVINIYTIPLFGMYGPAITGIISYSFMAITLFLCFAKKNKLFKKID